VLCGSAIADTGTTTSGTTDPNPANNMATIATAVQSESDLSIEKVGGGTVSWGQIFEYTLTVRNAGVSTSHATTVVDTVPSAFTVLKAEPTQGTCSVSPSNTVTCNLGDLGAANQCASFPNQARVVISVRVRPVPPGSVVNTATVASGNCLPDPNPDDNTASTTTFITASAPDSDMRRDVPVPVLSELAIVVLALVLGVLAIRRLGRRE
jgi:uncharacterized repeat protein (TIGR01451 family)